MKPITTFIFSLFSFFLTAQLTGTITDTKGEVLPFANVYIEGTTQGTTANTEGVYFFDLKNGTYPIVFQYIGYKKRIETVTVSGKTKLNISLEALETELTEVVVKANAEDPAYAIIRKAQEMRKTYRDEVPAYTCDVYIKGLQKIADAPKKIFGREVGDLGGNLDTTEGKRQGIVYLSETLSRYYVNGSKRKEVLRSAKVSGNPNGFGFNRAELFDFSFYDNHINIQRDLLSPIGDAAMAYYKYRFVHSFRDTLGFMVNKIEVIPRRKEDPTWAGYIYIVDNQWNIYSTDLYCTGKSIQIDILDTIQLRQTHVPTEGGRWRPISQTLSFKFGLLGFKVKGYFTGVFSNYNLNPVFEKDFFNNEIFKAQKGQLDNKVEYWDTLRPVELTQEERRDYIRKDSIRAVKLTPQYMDSVDKVSNKFRLINLITSYTYRQSKKRLNLTWNSPISSIGFNPIQGLNALSNLQYDKSYGAIGDPYTSRLTLRGEANYGFSERQLRGSGGMSYLFNRFNYATLDIDAGYQMQQYNAAKPINTTVASLYALYVKRHLWYVYDRKFVSTSYAQDIANGLKMTVGWESAWRDDNLTINSQYSFRKKEALYNANTPLVLDKNDGIEPIGQNNGQLHRASISLRWIPMNKYATYPHYKDNEGSKLPTFAATYRKAFGLNDVSARFDWLGLALDYDKTMGLLGLSEVRAQLRMFLNADNPSLADLNHLNGNETFLNLDLHYLNGFMRLPYYAYSTRDPLTTLHWQHHFKGFLFDKIPLIRKLRFSEVARVAYAYTPQYGSYLELGVGIDNIGWGLFRFLRVDVVWNKPFEQSGFSGKPGVLIGLKL